MTQVRRALKSWYLQTANQAQLRDMLPTNLQTPAEWARRSRSATINNYSLVDECDVYSLTLLRVFYVYSQILFPTTSVQDTNMQATRGSIIRHVNSPKVIHFVATKQIRSWRLLHCDTRHSGCACVATEWDSEQKTQPGRHNAPPDPAGFLDTSPDGLPPGVSFSVWSLLSYRSVSAPDSLPPTDRRFVTLDVADLSNQQGKGVAEVTSTPLHPSPPPVPPSSVPTYLVKVGPAPHASTSRLSGPRNPVRHDSNDTGPAETCWASRFGTERIFRRTSP